MTRYGLVVRGSNPGGCEIFLACPYWPGGPPGFLYNSYCVFPSGGKRAGRCVDRPFCLHGVDGVDFRRVYCKRATVGFMHVNCAAREVLSIQ
jgi:hypothetical protein